MARRRTTVRFLDPEDTFQKVTRHRNIFTVSPVYEPVRDLISDEYSEILKLLETELEQNNLLRRAWDEAKKILKDIKKEISSHLPDECLLAVIVYTMSDPNVYVVFNSQCREMKNVSDWEKFQFKSLYALLVRGLQEFRNYPKVDRKFYYRGINHTIDNLKVGDVFFSKQFLSCSSTKQIAEEFIGDSGTLITFEGCPLAACGISDYSEYPDENELLLFPWNVFEVSEIKENKKGPYYRQIRDEVRFQVVKSFDKHLAYSGKYIEKGIIIENF